MQISVLHSHNCGIAETATVVQASGEESGRAISLLPTTHIAVLYTDTINPRMTQTMENPMAERYHKIHPNSLQISV